MKFDVQKETVVVVYGLNLFYAHVVAQMPRVFVNNNTVSSAGFIPTVGVGKRHGDKLIKLYVNEDFVKGLWDKIGEKNLNVFDNMYGAIMQHEVLHIVFGHLDIDLPDKKRAMIATDLAVNSYIDRDKLPEGCVYPDDFKLESKQSAMWYYNALRDNKKFEDMKTPSNAGSHDWWDAVKSDPASAEYMRQVVGEAVKMCKNGYGNLPGDLVEIIEKLIAPRKSYVNWRSQFRGFTASASDNSIRFTLKRRSKRYGTRPGTIIDTAVRMAFIIDTSGSMSTPQIQLARGELALAARAGAVIDVIEADTMVQTVYRFRGKLPEEVKGRGGTDLNPALKFVNENGKYDAIVYFTDFEAGAVTEKPKAPLLWLLSNEGMTSEHYPCTFGRVIKMPDPAKQERY